ncbi:GAF domain-containing sensor histidine kinase [Pseudobacteriovorax antillogorgiicola]|uniref:GAF domain-containing protein n=1 Tax=Pseudobacteriovorax antillogorgiicola TaxID=1513793 RepID=A0A1Y6B9U6_9BACT|nr:GAF domain-containing sensor histidine kinase [Pseudobacteriovorax antillogorgiicola]TCS57490.1 GAF domain-containing protein [Pseudobacteriovorax antillogorgiicola]SMF00474.1 GAF domain-containing protein [Pseudobacteriovorax antillogorgiicola]
MDVNKLFETMDRIFNHSQESFGIAYIKRVAQKVSKELDIKYVLIGRPKHDSPDIIKTDICISGGELQDNIEYHLDGTPCKQVLTGQRVCIHPKKAAELFPDDILLEKMSVKSYAGAPMIDWAGQIMGLVVLLDIKPMSDPSVLSVFTEFLAGRVAVEYERELSETTLRNINEQLALKVDEQTQKLKMEKKRLESVNSELQVISEELQLSKKRETQAARISGMAEMSNLTLHTIGNSINSITIENEMSEAIQLDFQRIGQALESLEENFVQLMKQGRQDEVQAGIRKIAKIQSDVVNRMSLHRSRMSNSIDLVKKSLVYQSRYSNQQEPSTHQINLASIVDDALNSLKPRLDQAGIQVSTELPDHIFVVGEEHKFFHALLTLLNNSIDAIHEAKKSSKTILIQLSEDSQWTYINIVDSGLGIADENIDKIFNFGFTTKDHGTGVGLHDVSTYISQIGGKVTLKNIGRDQGAIASLILPKVHGLNVMEGQAGSG